MESKKPYFVHLSALNKSLVAHVLRKDLTHSTRTVIHDAPKLGEREDGFVSMTQATIEMLMRTLATAVIEAVEAHQTAIDGYSISTYTDILDDLAHEYHTA